MSQGLGWILAALAFALAIAAVSMWRRARDVNRELEREMRESERRASDAADATKRAQLLERALPDGVVILHDGRIEWANANAGLHFGIDAARDHGTPIGEVIRDAAFLSYLEAADLSGSVELHPAASPGRVLQIQAVQGDGRVVLVSRDVSHVRRLEQVGRDFVANVSHELRTPLTVISGFVETLRDETDPKASQRYLDLMEEQSRRMRRLVEDLLTLSSLESSPPPPDEPIDMHAMVERLAADARALSKGRHVVEVENETELDLAGSEKELESALGNLVSNAVRYTPEGGTVRLQWHGSGEGADFDVEDTGIGIAAEHIPRLTERFYRVDRGRSRESGGTGLGLAIVKHALQRHGAALHIGSTPGKGSRFSARFPRMRVRKK